MHFCLYFCTEASEKNVLKSGNFLKTGISEQVTWLVILAGTSGCQTPEGNDQLVCAVFFRHTLGYQHNKIITHTLESARQGAINTPTDMRGKHEPKAQTHRWCSWHHKDAHQFVPPICQPLQKSIVSYRWYRSWNPIQSFTSNYGYHRLQLLLILIKLWI